MREDAKLVVDALIEFVEHASKIDATAAEVEALPAVAEILLNYFSSGILDTAPAPDALQDKESWTILGKPGNKIDTVTLSLGGGEQE